MSLPGQIRLLPTYVCYGFPALVLFAMAPLLQLAFFSHPVADDFCFGTDDPEGLFRVIGESLASVAHSYVNWSGAWTSIALQRMLPGIVDFTRFHFVFPLGLILLTLAGILFLVRSAFPQPRITLAALVLATTAWALYLVTMPTLPQGIYWFTAAMAYHVGSISTVVLLGLLIRLLIRDSSTPPGPLHIAGLALVITFTIGLNEITLLTTLSIMVGATVREYFYQGAHRKLLLGLCILTIVLAAAYLLAPGNYSRAQHFPNRYDLAGSVSDSFYWGWRKIGNWVSQPQLWIATLIAFWSFSLMPAGRVASYRPNRIFIFIFPVVTVLFIIALFFPQHWATGDLVAPRVVNVIYFDFLILWFWYCFILYRGFAAWRVTSIGIPSFTVTPRVIPALLLLAFAGSIYIHPAMSLARLDLVGRALDFHVTHIERYRVIRAWQPEEESPVVVPGLVHDVPRTIYFSTIRDNPRSWENQCMATYFGVPSVIAVK